MLKNDLEQMKREHPKELNDQKGACYFCGQIALIETFLPWNEENCNEAATELCDCFEAKNYTKKKMQKEHAKKAIRKQFGQQAAGNEVEETLISIMDEIAGLIIEGKLTSATIDIGNGLKGKILVTSKGLIKVERIKTEKTAQEA